MPLYFFHLRDGTDTLLDPEGREIDSVDELPAKALADARSIIGHDAVKGRIRLDQHIDVEDEAGNILHIVHFIDAVEIVFPA
jgi:hypothetical protein